MPHAPIVLDTLESGSLLTPAGYLEKEPDVQPSYRSELERLEQLGFPRDCKPGTPEWKKKTGIQG